MNGTQPPQKKSHTMRNLAIVVVLVLLVVIIGIPSLNNVTQRTSSGGGIIPKERSTNIVNAMITVGARNYQAYPFTVPSGATDVHVRGTFTASGGGGNDIIVLIMDETAFTNWKNGHEVSVFYNSNKLTTSNFDVPLVAGRAYYLVYSNQFSLITGKNVRTTADLIYTI